MKPTELEAFLDITKQDTVCDITVVSTNGEKLTAQLILDAVVDMLMEYYGMSEDDWKKLEDGMDS